MSLKGKFALVTGAAGGIGMSVAEKLSEAGCQVIATDMTDKEEARNKMAGKQHVSEISYIRCDLRRHEDIGELFKEVETICAEGIDILVNVAGVASFSALLENLSVEEWNAKLDVNLSAPFFLTKHVLPTMKKKKWGRIVNVSSVLGIVGYTRCAAYVASKTGLVGLTRAIALETAEYGITCNAICPGTIDTPITRRSFREMAETSKSTYEEVKEGFENRIPTRALLDVSEISSFVLFLCSAAAKNLTGASIPMDGGRVAQ